MIKLCNLDESVRSWLEFYDLYFIAVPVFECSSVSE